MILSGITTSAVILFPLPSIMLIADDFLSVHKLPERETLFISGNLDSIKFNAASVPIVTPFIPMESPVS